MKKTNKILVVLFCTLIFIIPKSVAGATFPILTTYVSDTIAGYTTAIKTETRFTNQDIQFKVIKPNKTELIIEAKTDHEGKAVVDLYDYHTQMAGIYSACAKFTHQEEFGSCATFQVYADDISPHTSYVETNKKTAAANGYDIIDMTINLRDKYGNPISNHQLNVIPSRPEDKIALASGSSFTNEKGKIHYTATTSKEGIGIFSFFDVTQNIALEQRVNAIFFKTPHINKEMGGTTDVFLSQLNTQLLAQSQQYAEVAYFQIEGIADEAETNQTLTFTVTAYDINSNVASNYTGKVRFSTTDNNATLPSDYEFKDEDLGKHTFSLGLTFLTPGTHKITVTDIDDSKKAGEKQVEVLTQNKKQPSGSITLDEPASGTYQTTILNVSGQTNPDTPVALYIDDINTKTAVSDNKGGFTLETPVLRDGEHILYAAKTDKDGNIVAISESVTVTTDTSAPAIDSLELKPSTKVFPGSKIEATIYSENDLTQAAIIINNKMIELLPSLEISGGYKAVFQAPEQEGTYPIDVIIVDLLGNEASYTNQKMLEVTKDIQPTGFIPEIGSGKNPPTVVKNIQAIPGDQKVTLYFETAQDDTYIIHYRIYYGTNSDQLDQHVNTLTNDNTWYVPELNNGTTYYFSITAFDSDGNESPELSAIISGLPRQTTTIAQLTTGNTQSSKESQINQDKKATTMPIIPEEQPKSGPETLIILLFTLGFMNIYFLLKLKPKAGKENTEKSTTPYSYRFQK